MDSPDAPDIIKYFYEEPASLETLAPDDDADARGQREPMTLEAFMNAPRYYRGYVAGSSPGRGTTGLTSLARPDALLDLLMELRAGRPLSVWMVDGTEPAGDPRLLLERPGDVLLALFGEGPLDLSTVAALAAEERRRALGFLRNILDEGTPVLFPEPAHHGYDWSVFSQFPLVERARRGLSRVASPSLRTFAIPHVKARSEDKFYFERYDLSLFDEFEITR